MQDFIVVSNVLNYVEQKKTDNEKKDTARHGWRENAGFLHFELLVSREMREKGKENTNKTRVARERVNFPASLFNHASPVVAAAAGRRARGFA